MEISSAIVFGPTIRSFENAHGRKVGERGLDMAPDPGGDIFRGRILQPFDFVQAMMVEPFQQCRERSLNVEEVDQKAGRFVDLPLEHDFDSVRMTVHSVAAMLDRY